MTKVIHRCYVSHAEAHYGGALVDGAFALARFGDAATELAIREGGDEGLLAGYEQVSFHAPVRAGDVLEVSAETVATGRRSRTVDFTALVVCRAEPGRGPTAATVCDPVLLAVTARGTVVLPRPAG